jgi:hypothetical protein
MNATILAAVRSIVLLATVTIAGVKVRRTSIAGFAVAGIKMTLSAIDAATAIADEIERAALDSSWTEIAATTVTMVAAKVKAVAATVARIVRKAPHNFFCAMVDAISSLRGMATMVLKTAVSLSGAKKVVVTCYAGSGATMDQHNQAAVNVARELRSQGHRAVAVGNMVEAYAA